MSAIAWFYVIDRAAAGEIAATVDPDAAYEILRTRGRSLDNDLFLWSGYCMVDLLDFLTSRGISAAAGEPDVSGALPVLAFAFGPADRQLRTRFDPESFTSEELTESMAAFEFDATEAVFAATDGLNALRIGIEALGEDDLLVITVG